MPEMQSVARSLAQRLAGGRTDGRPPAGPGIAGLRGGAPEAVATEMPVLIPTAQLPEGMKIGDSVTIEASVKNVTPAGAEIDIVKIEPIGGQGLEAGLEGRVEEGLNAE